jgi:hypothetical protein
MRRFIASGTIENVCYSLDGRTLSCAEHDGSLRGQHVRRFRLDTGEEVERFDLEEACRWPIAYPDSQLGQVALSPKGDVAVQQHIGDPILLKYRPAGSGVWREIELFSEHDFCAEAPTFSPSGRQFAFASGTDGGGAHWIERR